MSSPGHGRATDAHSENIPYDLLDHCSDLIQSVSPEGKFLYVNRAWLDTLGYGHAEVSGLKVFDVIHPDCRAHCEQIFQRLIAGEDVGLFEVVFAAKDGREVVVEGRVNCRQEGKSVVATRGIFRDVTQSRATGSSLRKREAVLHATGENLPGGAVYQLTRMASGQLRCDYLSGSIVALSGLSAESIKAAPRKIFECIIPEDMPRWKQAAKHSSEHLATLDVEVRYRAVNGGLRWIQSLAKPSRAPDGGTTWEGLILDVTERKRAEEELRRQTERLQIAQRAARIIVLDWDIEKDELHFSDSPEWLRGPLPAGAKYPLFKDQVHPEDRAKFLAMRDRAVETAQGVMEDYRLIRTDGTVLWIHSHQVMIPGPDGRAQRMIVALRDVTEEKGIERALAESVHRFKALTAMSSDWYWEQDVDFRFTEIHTGADPGFQIPIGYTRWELDSLGVSPQEWESHRRLLREHRPFRDFEFGRYALDGSPLWYSVSGDPKFDKDGRFTGYFGVGKDISRRKRMEADLALARERLALALSGSKLAVWDWDERAGKVYLSKEWNAMLGRPPQASEIPVKELFHFAHPEDHERIGLARLGVLKGPGQDYRVEHRVRMADGGWKWILSYGTVTERAPNGHILRITGINADIDDLKQVEAQLRATLLEQNALLSSSPAGIFIVSAGRLILRANETMERMFGYGRMEMAGMRTRDLCASEEDWAWIGRQGYEQAESGKMMRGEIQYRRKDGSKFWGLLQGVAIDAKNSAGEKLFAVVDISDSRKTQAELRSAKEAADRANRAKSEFLSRMSHELRTPLNAILGFSELFTVGANGPLTDDQRQCAEQIHMAGKHLLDMVNDVLDLSRIESDRIEVSLEPVHFENIFLEVVGMSETMSRQHGISISVDEDALSLPPVMADPKRLRQALLNLLTNAIKYNRDGGSVNLRALEQGEHRVRIEVEDTGHGIAPEKLGSLFQPFNRLGLEASGIDGTGIGLALSKRLVELMGGRIGVRSTPGAGSVFWIELSYAPEIARVTPSRVFPVP
ncbi:MAG: PAS domain S-box protein [Burkholderiales bacterium]